MEVAVVERIKFIHLAFFPATHKDWDSKENKRELKAETSEFSGRKPNELKQDRNKMAQNDIATEKAKPLSSDCKL